MKVSNKLNLPEAFVKAVSVTRHNAPGCYSATTLNKGTKEIILTDRHFDEIEVDASDNVWAVFGTAVHKIMQAQDSSFLLYILKSVVEEYKNRKTEGDETEFTYFESVINRIKGFIKSKYAGNSFVEESFKIPVGNSFVTGQVDSYDMENATIYDWKTARVWKIQYADFTDWRQQGLTYAWLLQQSGLEVKKCRFVALLKDHSKSKAKFDANYPQSPVYIYEFAVTPADLEATCARILKKVQEIEAAQKMSDDEIEACTAEERWADAEKWALMKNGRKTAVKLYDNQQEAEAAAGEQGNSYYVEPRPAVSRKCGDYCNACKWCNFYKSMNKGGE